MLKERLLNRLDFVIFYDLRELRFPNTPLPQRIFPPENLEEPE